jgi:hypothetical protein
MCKLAKTQRLEFNGRGRLPSDSHSAVPNAHSQSTLAAAEQDANSVVMNRGNYLFAAYQANWNKAPVPS